MLILIRASLVILMLSLFGCTTTTGSPAAKQSASAELEALSPDGLVALRFSVDAGIPRYEVSYRGSPVLAPSSLGLVLQDLPDIATALKIVAANQSSNTDKWQPVWGTKSEIEDNYRQLTVELAENTTLARRLNIEFRIYNDGVAFRYEIPPQEGLAQFVINDEYTSFNFNADHDAYIGIMREDGFAQSQQVEYQPMSVAEFPRDKLASFPALVKAGAIWAAIAEAEVVDYADALLAPADGNAFSLHLNRPPKAARAEIPSSAPRVTPWRLVMLAEHPGKFLESNLIANLNAPSTVADTSWIKPGKALWPWWNGRLPYGEPSTEQMKNYIDFAAAKDIPFIVVDAGWYSTEEEAWADPDAEDIFTMEETRVDNYDIREVIDYASEHNVGVHLWVHGATLDRQMDEALEAFAKWGVVGIKADSWHNGDRGDYAAVEYFHELLQKSAEHHIMINHHGWYKPTGISRTYPHLLTREAVMGLEHAKWSDKPSVEHNVTLAYTRAILGQMDYTPGAFDLTGTDKQPKQVQGTRAQQLAMYVVYFSPLQMLPDSPEVYQQNPKEFEFVLDVPTVWDDTKFIAGDIADYIAVARRSDNDWYVGVITDDSEREVTVPLDFLAEGNYRAEIYSDSGAGPEQVEYTIKNVGPGSTLEAKLASGGGYAVHISPVRPETN